MRTSRMIGIVSAMAATVLVGGLNGSANAAEARRAGEVIIRPALAQAPSSRSAAFYIDTRLPAGVGCEVRTDQKPGTVGNLRPHLHPGGISHTRLLLPPQKPSGRYSHYNYYVHVTCADVTTSASFGVQRVVVNKVDPGSHVFARRSAPKEFFVDVVATRSPRYIIATSVQQLVTSVRVQHAQPQIPADFNTHADFNQLSGQATFVPNLSSDEFIFTNVVKPNPKTGKEEWPTYESIVGVTR